MEDIKDIYIIGHLDQLRVLYDSRRISILTRLVQEPLTIAELSNELGVALEVVHSQIQDLERSGFIRKIERSQLGDTIEAAYRTVARQFILSPYIHRTTSRDEITNSVQELLTHLAQEAIKATIPTSKNPDTEEKITIVRKVVWFPESTFREIENQIEILLNSWARPHRFEGEREWVINIVAHTTSPNDVNQEEGSSDVRSGEPSESELSKRRFVFAMEGASYTRQNLEEILAAGERLDLFALGSCYFAEDISVDLIDQTIASFCHQGDLHASPEVYQILTQKSSPSW